MSCSTNSCRLSRTIDKSLINPQAPCSPGCLSGMCSVGGALTAGFTAANTWDPGACVFLPGSADLGFMYLLDLTSGKLSTVLALSRCSEPDRRQTDGHIRAQRACTMLIRRLTTPAAPESRFQEASREHPLPGSWSPGSPSSAVFSASLQAAGVFLSDCPSSISLQVFTSSSETQLPTLGSQLVHSEPRSFFLSLFSASSQA